jgi:hypothetical protein
MQRPVRSTYTPLDFLAWREAESLVLVPKFQRRGVWSASARSFLIDTIIRGLPVPPIYLRVTQSEDRTRTIREVVDGQQRVATVLNFIDEEYELSRSLDAPYAGMSFSDLTRSQQDSIRQYGFICEVLHGVSDAQVLEIFARLNTYSVKLNAQELRNGRYFGYFKQTAYRLAHEHIEFWRRHHIFSEQSIARMLEVELTSELMIAELDGLQDKKTSINRFYAQFDDRFPQRSRLEKHFRLTLDVIDETFRESLTTSEFRRPPLFYSLFCAINHRTFGLPKQRLNTPRRQPTETERRGIRAAMETLSEKIALARVGEPMPSKYVPFVTACLRQTDNIQPRQIRLTTLYREAF